ncbi:MAG: AraC family transcriptional regulator [Planctomycetota bacterium]
MFSFTYFRILEEVPDWPTPFYLGRGEAYNPHYNSLTNPVPPLKWHYVAKISLGEGGLYGDAERTVPMRPGDVVLREFGKTEVWDRYNPEHTGDWQFIGLIFRGASALTLCRSMCQTFGHLYHLPTDSTVVQNLIVMAEQPTQNTDITATAGVKLVVDLLLAMAHETEQARIEPNSGRLIQAVTEYIRANLDKDYSVAQLAEMHGVSREHLTRLFKQSVGRPPHEYIIQARIHEACQLLIHTSLPTKTVAARVGFQSMSTFFRKFRQITSQSPNGYRQTASRSDVSYFADALKNESEDTGQLDGSRVGPSPP